MDDYEDSGYEQPLLTPEERGGPVVITLAGYSAAAIETIVARHIAAQCQEQVRKAVTRAVEKVVNDAVRESAASHVAPIVAKAIEEGWQKTDSYGSPSGEKKTLSVLVREYLTAREQYGKGLNIEAIANKAIEEGVKTALAAEVATLRAKFAAMVDDVLKAKFSQIMRDAIGLKS